MVFLKNIYRHMPEPFKLPVDFFYGLIPNSIRYGKKYRRMKKFLNRSQWWSEDEHTAHQEMQVKSVLIHAYEHVPYYRRIFDQYGFNPYEFKRLEEMETLPLLDKDIIQENFADLLADNFPVQKTVQNTTGGTSGNQLKFYAEDNYNQVEKPFVELIWERAGYANNSRVAVLRNESFSDGKIFDYDWKQRSLILDNFHLTDANIRKTLDKLDRDRIDFIHTYPSAILSICDYIRRSGYRVKYRPKAILATSENIYPGQKEVIEGTLNCRLFTFYGHSERACIAGWCEHSDFYHIQSEYGYMELLDEEHNPISETGRMGEIVCTGFFNRAMPFIRYRTGDYSSYADRGSCTCGRNYRLLNDVKGRWLQEMLVCREGIKVSITALNMHSEIFDHVEKYQFYQDRPGECIFNIVKAENYSIEDETKIKGELLKKLGNSIDLIINYTDDIEKTERGKYKYLVQKLPL